MTCHIVLLDDRRNAPDEWAIALRKYEERRPAGGRPRDWRLHSLGSKTVDAAFESFRLKLNELAADHNRNPGPLVTVLMVDGVINLSTPTPHECDGYTQLYPRLAANGVHWLAEAFVTQYRAATGSPNRVKFIEGSQAIEHARSLATGVNRQFFDSLAPEEPVRFAIWANAVADAAGVW